MELKQASEIAVAICYKLQPHCELIKIAGSIRRKRTEVKDIELVAAPKVIPVRNLFHQQVGELIDPNFSVLVKNLGTVELGKPDGRYMKILLPEGIKLDLFIPQRSDFYRQYAIRTGSKEYSFALAAKWVANGWCGTEDGLRLQSECYKDSSDKWHCSVKPPTLPPVWESEESFFSFLGIEWIKPEYRNV
jgi:DNA polymerase/3'-5' exonuclease PolX